MLKLSNHIQKKYLFFAVAAILFISNFFVMYAVQDVVKEKKKTI